MTLRDHHSLPADRYGNQRGSVMPLFILTLVVLLLVTSLAVDIPATNMRQSKLAKAIDAGVLAAARRTSMGEQGMVDTAIAIANANLGAAAVDSPVSFTAVVDSPSIDTVRIRLRGKQESETPLGAIAGIHAIAIGTNAEATRYPADIALSLDLSGSLERNNVFDDMQEGASQFIGYFDDNLDQFGIVTYSTWVEERMAPQKSFSITADDLIHDLVGFTDTNIQEGLRLAKAQIDAAPVRPSAEKAVVIFTDGRPTAFCDTFEMRNHDPAEKVTMCHSDDGSGGHTISIAAPAVPAHVAHGDSIGACPGEVDPNEAVGCEGSVKVPPYFHGCIAGYVNGGSYRGLFMRDTGRKVIDFIGPECTPITVDNDSSETSPKPHKLPDGSSVNGGNIRTAAAAAAEVEGDLIRNAGYTIYAVVLGNPGAITEGDTPDLELMRRISNDRYTTSRLQPKGAMIFAPTPEDLENAFEETASRIVVRLTS